MIKKEPDQLARHEIVVRVTTSQPV